MLVQQRPFSLIKFAMQHWRGEGDLSEVLHLSPEGSSPSSLGTRPFEIRRAQHDNVSFSSRHFPTPGEFVCRRLINSTLFDDNRCSSWTHAAAHREGRVGCHKLKQRLEPRSEDSKRGLLLTSTSQSIASAVMRYERDRKLHMSPPGF